MPKIEYRIKDGTIVPGCSTIASGWNFPDKSGAMIGWAINKMKAGEDPREQTGAESGTLAHAMIHAHVWGLPEPKKEGYLSAHISRAEDAFLAYLEFEKQYRIVPLVKYCEKPLVSENWRTGGTPDFPCYIGDDQKIGMLDFKVTNDIRSSHRIQLSGYGLIWTDCYPNMPLEGGYHLLRLGKDDKAGSFEHSYWPHLKLHERKFILLRELYEDYKLV